MTAGEGSPLDIVAIDALDIDTDALFDVLSNSRRRFVITCLDKFRNPVALADVADELAIWEYEAPITEIPAEDVKAIYDSLYHNHVPRIEAAELVEYNQERDVVALTQVGEKVVSHLNLPSIRE